MSQVMEEYVAGTAATADEASTEALRLKAAHLDQQFGVFHWREVSEDIRPELFVNPWFILGKRRRPL